MKEAFGERGQYGHPRHSLADLQAVFIAGIPQDSIGEQKGWELIIQAQAGLAAFHGMVDDHEKGGSLRGPRTATTKAFHKSLLGYRTAFPDEITMPGIQRAIEIAATRCAESFAFEVDETTDQEKYALLQELHTNILDALMKEVVGSHGQI